MTEASSAIDRYAGRHARKGKAEPVGSILMVVDVEEQWVEDFTVWSSSDS